MCPHVGLPGATVSGRRPNLEWIKVRRTAVPVVLVALALGAAVLGVVRYFAFLPLYGHKGPLPPATLEERHLAPRLREHVVAVASVPHNMQHPEALEAAAVYIERRLADLGFGIERHELVVAGQKLRNVHVAIGPGGGGQAPSFVVGAHYDSAGIAPGANDNGTGVATLIELARLLRDHKPRRHRLRLVFFVNEELPASASEWMGSVHFARMLAARERVAGMISIETIGAYSDMPGTQRFPFPFNAVYRDTANFITFVGMPRARDLVHQALGSFRRHTAFPSIGGVSHAVVPGVSWSDHASFDALGIPAIMVTDTALYRYAHYHKATDTPDKVDYDRLARVTKGLERTLREIVD